MASVLSLTPHTHFDLQWNLRIKDTLGQGVLSFIERFPYSEVGIIGIGTSRFVLYREVSFIQRLKCTGIIEIGTSRFVLYREVFFFRSVLYQLSWTVQSHCSFS